MVDGRNVDSTPLTAVLAKKRCLVPGLSCAVDLKGGDWCIAFPTRHIRLVYAHTRCVYEYTRYMSRKKTKLVVVHTEVSTGYTASLS